MSQLELKVELEQLVKKGAPGAIAYFKNDGRVTFEAAGLADRRTGRPPSRNDVWRVASVTKVVTAALVLKLAHNKQINLDARLGTLGPANGLELRPGDDEAVTGDGGEAGDEKGSDHVEAHERIARSR